MSGVQGLPTITLIMSAGQLSPNRSFNVAAWKTSPPPASGHPLSFVRRGET